MSSIRKSAQLSLSLSTGFCTDFCSGIDLTHPEFEGRAKLGVDTVDDPPRMDDPNGHGTHVAGEMCSHYGHNYDTIIPV